MRHNIIILLVIIIIDMQTIEFLGVSRLHAQAFMNCSIKLMSCTDTMYNKIIQFESQHSGDYARKSAVFLVVLAGLCIDQMRNYLMR